MYIHTPTTYSHSRSHLRINIIPITKESILIFYNENNKIVEKERTHHKKIKSLKNKYQTTDLYSSGVGISSDSVLRQRRGKINKGRSFLKVNCHNCTQKKESLKSCTFTVTLQQRRCSTINNA